MALVLLCSKTHAWSAVSKGQAPAHPTQTRVANGVDALILCPYSEETLTGCRFYQPISEHGGFPEAGQCKDAFLISGADHIRSTICARRR
jgi:hypothetical protein